MTQAKLKPDFEQHYTVKQFIKMPEFDEGYELVDGKLVEKPMPRFHHSRVARRIMKAFDKIDPDEKLGVMLQEVSVEIGENVLAPDVSFWVAERKPPEDIDLAPYPDLAIEVQSPGQGLKKLNEKAKAYLEAGVRLVWIIQPNKKIAAVFHQGQDIPVTIQPTGQLDGENVIPGFSLEVSELF